MFWAPLYDDEVIKKKFSGDEPTTFQIKTANRWLEMINNQELGNETDNYDLFKKEILINLLGYPSDEIKENKQYVEFSVTDVSKITHVIFEAKGTKTNNLFARQNYGKKELEHPVWQTSNDMQRFDPPATYGVCTNYNDFVLLDRDRGVTKCHRFTFTDIKNDLNKLKEFIGIFSYNDLVTKKSLVTLYEKSLIAEKDITKDFYILFHETRLMLIKVFQEKGVDKNEAIHFTQIFLNRLIFVFFVQGQDRLSDSQIFTVRLYSILESVKFTEHSKKVYDEISELFMAFKEGDHKLKIFGYGGELFNEVIPSNLYFSDLKDPDFFSDVRDNSKLLKSKKFNEKTQKIINRHENQLNPIVINLLRMASFDFKSEINVNILGHIFEQSISDLEDLKEGQISRRKQDGVYYTPEFITDHICRNTIIPYLSKTNVSTIDELIQEYFNDMHILEKKILELKILDPACGSGAFLNKASDLLLEIFKEIQNVKQSKGKHSTGDQFQLTSWNDESAIRRIIENNIYGVDLNYESIEITKLSIYLKFAAEHRKLIGLSKNFQSGNSIIDDRIVDPNGIHWEDSFPEILSPLLDVPGFDIVLGNPPYLKIEHLNENERNYFQEHFERTYMMRYDAYGLFLEKSASLLKKGGMLGMIIPSTILNNISFTKLRKFLLTSTTILQIVNLGGKVFEGVNVDALIIIFKNSSSDGFETEIYDVLKYGKGIATAKKTNTIDFQNISKEPHFSFEIRITKEFSKILERMETNSIPLGEICPTFQGFVTGHDNAYFVTDKEIDAENLERAICKPNAFGDEVSRYGHPKPSCYVIYITSNEKISDFPQIQKRFVQFKNILEKKLEVKQGTRPWYALHRPRNRTNFEHKEKLLVQKIRNLALKRRIVATIDYDGLFADQSINVCMPKNSDYDIRYVLGILNSNLVNYSFQTKYLDINIKGVYLDAIPIPKASSKNQQPLIEKVNKILTLNEKISDISRKFTDRVLQNLNLKNISNKLHNFEDLNFKELLNEFQNQKVMLSLKKQDEWERYFENEKMTKCDLKQEINQLENEIDEIVYALYGLTGDDIKIIEKNNK